MPFFCFMLAFKLILPYNKIALIKLTCSVMRQIMLF